MPPVIERAAQERVDRYAELAAARGPDRRPAPTPCPARGWFCPPTVAADLPAGSPVLDEEIFGPLLAIERVRDVEQACDVVDGLPFALTGGLFARDPGDGRATSASARRSATCTSTAGSPARWSAASRSAATACRAPGTKAGGPDYLLQFVEPRAVTENTMRHGLVV